MKALRDQFETMNTTAVYERIAIKRIQQIQLKWWLRIVLGVPIQMGRKLLQLLKPVELVMEVAPDQPPKQPHEWRKQECQLVVWRI